MAVSCWLASVAAVVSLVSMSPRGCVMCAKKFALRGLVVGVCAKKFALRAQNTPKLVLLALLGELFRGNAAGSPVLGELFRGLSGGEGVLGEFFRVCRHGSHVSQVRWHPTCRKWWGVLHDTKPSSCVSPACRSLMSCNSLDWCLSVRGAVPKVQTASAKNAEDGLVVAKRSAFWAQRCLSCVLFACEPAIASDNPLCHTQTPYLERGRGCPGSY